MASEYTPCAYHPKKVAVTTCERCKRAICLEDKRIIRTSSSSSSTTYVHEYCIICYASQMKNKTKSMVFASLLSLGIFSIVFIILINDNEISSADYAPYFLFTILFFFIFLAASKSIKKKALEAEKEANIFANSLENREVLSNSSSGASDVNAFDNFSTTNKGALSCFQCGGYLTLKDRFCPNCGDDTKEERQAFTHA